jgi:hypothetical protein
MSLTVLPLHDLDIGPGARIPFGKNFVLQDVPSWLIQDKATMSDLSQRDRTLVLDSKHALVSEYEAVPTESQIPSGKGKDLATSRALASRRQFWRISAFG